MSTSNLPYNPYDSCHPSGCKSPIRELGYKVAAIDKTTWRQRLKPANSLRALLREQIICSLAPDTDGVPDFRHALRRHCMLEHVRAAARAGRKVTLADDLYERAPLPENIRLHGRLYGHP